jgi:spore coat protein H
LGFAHLETQEIAAYAYVEAKVTIDGVTFPRVGIRKKGFIGSLSRTRPSLKIKLDFIDEEGNIDGLNNLTFNNNQQDVSQMSQFIGYSLFNAAGSPAPRSALAKVRVNGRNLGVYSHV